MRILRVLMGAPDTGTILSYTDHETGERHHLDVTGWQVVLDTAAGEVMRCELVMLALMIEAHARRDPSGGFDHSLTTFDGSGVLVEKPEYWWDVRVTKSGGRVSGQATPPNLT